MTGATVSCSGLQGAWPVVTPTRRPITPVEDYRWPLGRPGDALVLTGHALFPTGIELTVRPAVTPVGDVAPTWPLDPRRDWPPPVPLSKRARQTESERAWITLRVVTPRPGGHHT